MTIKVYRWRLKGRGAGDVSWKTEGELRLDVKDFPMLLSFIMKASFVKLTKGEAIFGEPGRGCEGPYDIDEIEVTQERVQ